MRRSFAALALAVVFPVGAVLAPAARADVTVKSGETLSEIAERHGVSLNRLMQANGIKDPTLLQAGQRLVIPGAGRATAASPAARAGGSVTVRSGETLSEIADRHGVSLNRLMQANGIKDPTLLQAGQRLVIPSAGRPAAAAATAAATPTGFYTVKNGETLSEIAARSGTSVERLMQLNGISNPDLVVAGTRLSVPMRARPAVAKAKPANARFHVVQSGETLSHISADYNVPVERLISLNRISDPNLLVAGTRLQLKPAPAVAKPKPRTIASKPKPKPKASKPAAAPSASPAETAKADTKPTPATAAKPAATPEPKQTAAPAETAAASSTASSPTQTTTPTAAAATTAKPSETPKPASPTATTTTATATATAASTTTPAAAAAATTATKPQAKATTTAQATKPAAKPATKPAAKASKPKPAAAVARKSAGPDWRTYGPMQVDWANWKAMGGSFVAPSLGSDGKPHYLAINCGARKLNATSQSGQWRAWDSPQNDYEQRLVSDLCSSKGG